MLRAKPSHLSGPVDEKALISENAQLNSALKSLAIVNKELAFQNAEKEKRAAELVVANKELAFQNAEKEKRAAELVIANKELAFQNAEKEKRAAELAIANEELIFQNAEKEKRAAELVIANKELTFQNAEKEKRAAELAIANEELAFQNAEKEKRAAELDIANEQLRGALMNTVRVAMILSELRDPYTAGHERRVAEIAVAISAELGFDIRRQEGIRVAGHLHDVGKMLIPAEILSKPGKLTEIEYALVRQHAQAGYDVLKGVEFPWPIAEVALQHHERIDGTGYPQGLRGEDIIIEARILAVADTVESMSSHRPYRAALGIDKALAEIEGGRGTAYDAVAADACLKLFREEGFNIPE